MTITPELPIVDLSGSGTRRAFCPHDCPDTCSMDVTVENGKATAVRGEPGPPVHPAAGCA